MHDFSICSVEIDCISWIKTFSPQRDCELTDFLQRSNFVQVSECPLEYVKG